MSEELKPCKECGSDYVGVESTLIGHTFFVMCHKCGYHGDLCNTEQDAIETWNRRADDGHKSED